MTKHETILATLRQHPDWLRYYTLAEIARRVKASTRTVSLAFSAYLEEQRREA